MSDICPECGGEPGCLVRIRELEAQAAAMREALEAFDKDGDYSAKLGVKLVGALAPDAGKALLERLEKAERDAAEMAATQCEEPIAEEHGYMLCGVVEKACAHGRREGLEEAAKVAEKATDEVNTDAGCLARSISAAIRARIGGGT